VKKITPYDCQSKIKITPYDWQSKIDANGTKNQFHEITEKVLHFSGHR